MAVAPTSLPTPVIDPADVAAILPSLTPEEAALYASLATLVLEAVMWPKAVPDPLPPPVNAAGLSIAVRLAQAGEAGGGEAGPVVSETIGGYTYRLATPDSLASGFALTEAERALLEPWCPSLATAYDVSTLGDTYTWPPEWWQRNYDLLEAPPEEP